MAYINLHTHSKFSDGTLSPNDLIKFAKSRNVRYFSLTDHDTVNSYEFIDKKLIEDIVFITGVEISTRENDYLHILGYKITLNNKQLLKSLDEWRKKRILRVGEMIKKLNEIGINISFDELNMDELITVGRPHIADVLVKKGYGKTRSEVFYKYLVEGCYAYVEPLGPTIREAIDVIKNANGLGVLAHPAQIEGCFDIDELIRKYEFDGIEVFYPSHTATKVKKYLDIANKYNLIVTAGTDFHGPNTDRKVIDVFEYDISLYKWLI
jgi:predicted metal-dependent phosphoesterase TrpH